MRGKVRNDINIYLNKDFCEAAKNSFDGQEYVPFFRPITIPFEYKKGWVNVNSSEAIKNIQINKDGTITVIK
jgi:hypothetical protein